jgi:nicotinamidase-related amidase
LQATDTKEFTMSTALLVIDVQNDYFPDGKFPLWNTEATLQNIERAIEKAHAWKIPVIIIQHIADSSKGISPFFNEGTTGANVHPAILALAPKAPVVVKAFADSFVKTTLEETLVGLGVISKSAEKYRVSILADCCTTVSEILHLIALNAVSTRLQVATLEEALKTNHEVPA